MDLYQGQPVRVWWLHTTKLTPISEAYNFLADGKQLTYAGNLIDPNLITFKVVDPNGIISTSNYPNNAQTGPLAILIVKDGAGAYYADIFTVSSSPAGVWSVSVTAGPGTYVSYNTTSFALKTAPI